MVDSRLNFEEGFQRVCEVKLKGIEGTPTRSLGTLDELTVICRVSGCALTGTMAGKLAPRTMLKQSAF